MQYTSKYQQNNKAHVIQTNINKAIKPMLYTSKYQQNDKTHAKHNQISTKR